MATVTAPANGAALVRAAAGGVVPTRIKANRVHPRLAVDAPMTEADPATHPQRGAQTEQAAGVVNPADG